MEMGTTMTATRKMIVKLPLRRDVASDKIEVLMPKRHNYDIHKGRLDRRPRLPSLQNSRKLKGFGPATGRNQLSLDSGA